MDFLFTCFEQYEKEAQQLLALENPLPLPAYERILKLSLIHFSVPTRLGMISFAVFCL